MQMINTSRATVKSIQYNDEYVTKLVAALKGRNALCINYNLMTGKVSPGDEILINTTAVDLGLGSGGYHFVIANLDCKTSVSSQGHIMKLRYTPFQMRCLCAEAQESAYHDVFNRFDSLNGMKVIIGTLHSMLAPVVLCLKSFYRPAKIAYIMTDGGALPIWFSDTVRRLKEEGSLHRTITYGSAFGGDLECINIYTALIAAKEIAKADIAVVTMGPGIAGTATAYGFSGAEQGHIIDAVNQLGGAPIAVPRISFADSRDRHKGISHQSITVLSRLCSTKANIAIPGLTGEEGNRLNEQLVHSEMVKKHAVVFKEIDKVDAILHFKTDYLEKMGKGYEADRIFFITCGLAALLI